MIIKGFDQRERYGQQDLVLVVHPSDERSAGGKFNTDVGEGELAWQELCMSGLGRLGMHRFRQLYNNPELAEKFGLWSELAPGIVAVSPRFGASLCADRDVTGQRATPLNGNVILEHGASVDAARIQAARQLIINS